MFVFIRTLPHLKGKAETRIFVISLCEMPANNIIVLCNGLFGKAFNLSSSLHFHSGLIGRVKSINYYILRIFRSADVIANGPSLSVV